jgi:hypothetical protein
MRYHLHGLILYDDQGQKIDVEAVLRKATIAKVCLPVQVRSQKKEFINVEINQFKQKLESTEPVAAV